jgi:phage-related protein
MAVEVGTAFVTIVPSAKGFARKLQQSIGDEFVAGTKRPASDAGDKSSKTFSERFGAGLKSFLGSALRAAIKPALFAPVVAAAAGSLVQVMALVGPAIATASGALALLPAVGLGAAAAIGTLKIAFAGLGDVVGEAISGDVNKATEALAELPPAARDVGKAFIDMRPGIDAFRNAIAGSVLAGLGTQLRAIGQTYLPVITGQLSQIGGLFNTAFQQVAGIARSNDTFIGVQQALINIRAAIALLTPAIAPLVQAFTDVAIVGSNFLPQLAAGLGAAATGIAQFISSAAQSGQLATLIQNGLSTLGSLFGVVQQIGGIVVAVFSAAQQAVGGFQTPLVELLRSVNAFLSAGEGQSALIAVFSALSAAANALRPVIGTVLAALGQGLAALAPAFAPLIQAAGTLVTALAPILPVVGQLAGTLASALTPVISALAPALSGLVTGLTSIFGPLLPVITQIGTTLGQVLLPVAQVLGTVFTQIGAAVGPVIAALGTALAPLLTALGPLVTQLLAALAPLFPVLTVLAEPLVQIVVALTPVIQLIASLLSVVVAIAAPLIKLVATVIAFLASKALVPIISAIAQSFGVLAGFLQPVAQWLQKVAEWINNIDWGKTGTAIKDGFGAALSWLGSFFSNLWSTITGGLSTAVDAVLGFFAALPSKIGTAIAALPGIIGGAFKSAADAALFAVGYLIGLAIKGFLDLPGKIGAAVSALWSFVVDQFRAGVARAIAFWTEFVPSLIRKAIELRDGVINWIGNLVSSSISFFVNLANRLPQLASDAWSRVKSTVSSGVDAVISFAQSLPSRAASALSSFRDRIVGAVSNAIDGFRNVGSNIMSALADGIKSAVGRAIDAAVGAMKRVLDGAKRALGISSPSKEFLQIGKFAMLGYAAGVDKFAGHAEDAVLSALAPPSTALVAAAAAGAGSSGVVPAAAAGPIYAIVRVGDQPVREMVSAEITNNPQIVAEANEIGELQRSRR